MGASETALTSENGLEALGDGFRVLMLPDPQDGPAQSYQTGVRVPVSSSFLATLSAQNSPLARGAM